ncbi:MFS transporter [Veronia nyctiphanis]|uniref:MFS transporter n=1 Tax=Veronia nyctiphanis TaxID=1278244 RepID=A0A4Q0YM98_9GAMM|nr:sugar efflux transporter [Veronia nyctiphanis]RXJ71967.1 MFS transporter [Veronia nyctiphanis]
MRGESGLYLSVNVLTAMAYSVILPIMSLFLVEGLGIEPGYIGFYTVTTALAAIVISQFNGGLADKGVSEKKLMMVALSALALGGLSFSVLTEFWQAVLTGALFMSVGASSISMILTMIRGFAERSGKNSTRVMAQMRSSVSLLMIVSPSLAFLSIDYLGFSANFLLSATLAGLALLVTWRYLPDISKANVGSDSESHASSKMSPVVFYLGGIMLLASMARMSYMPAMPLYLTQDLGLPVSLPGILIGVGAACEVPLMLLAGKLAERYCKTRVIMFSFTCGLAFFVGLQFASEVWHFVALQILNGAFFGMYVSLAVTLLQDYAPNSIGKASAMYFNTMSAGSMIGSSLMGIIAQYYGYKNSFSLG